MCIMHQSFVTTAPMGPGNSRDFDFSLCKAWIYAMQCGDIFIESPAKILKGRCEITEAVLGMESKAWPLSPAMSPLSPGLQVTSA